LRSVEETQGTLRLRLGKLQLI